MLRSIARLGCAHSLPGTLLGLPESEPKIGGIDFDDGRLRASLGTRGSRVALATRELRRPSRSIGLLLHCFRNHRPRPDQVNHLRRPDIFLEALLRSSNSVMSGQGYTPNLPRISRALLSRSWSFLSSRGSRPRRRSSPCRTRTGYCRFACPT